MRFISYSQNREDVLLWRALQSIPRGFYIDVGANDPNEDSVTKAFYDRGWHGINIEPLPSHHKRLAELRPHDINLAIAAGATDGELELFDVPSVRGWATSSSEVAQLHRDQGHVVETSTVPVRRLSSICEEWVTSDIHFLKIDVEGFEADVIAGMDFERWRPWVVVVEATLPGSRISTHETWDPVLVRSRYRLVHFDGLNRFYVATEHEELSDFFATPPNVFDEYVFIGQVNAEEAAQTAQTAAAAQLKALDFQNQALDARLRVAHADIAAAAAHQQSADNAVLLANARASLAHYRESQAQHEAQAAQAQLQSRLGEAQQALARASEAESRCLLADQRTVAIHAHLDAVYRSKSWQLTKPLRLVLRLLQGVRRGALQRRLRAKLEARRNRLVSPVPVADGEAPLAAELTPAAANGTPRQAAPLTASARRILRDLTRAIEKT